MSHKDYDMLIKLLMVGDSGTGKSNILLQFTDNIFSPSFISTIGIDFKIKTIVINNKKIKLQIWDTAGQERFRTITTAYYRGAMGIMMIYDITDEKSFNNVHYWIKSIEQHSNENVEIILIGNKIDMKEKRAITFEQGSRLAQHYSKEKEVKFFEVSAKTGENINEAYSFLAEKISNKIINEVEKIDKIAFEEKPKKKRFC